MALIDGGQVRDIAFKMDLPNYGVFDEKRIFAPGDAPGLFDVRGVKIGVPICEDIWGPAPCADLVARGAEMLLVPNGSPYRRTSTGERMRIARDRVAETGLPLIYVNQVGGQDELVFDGGSFALDANGDTVMSLPTFEDALVLSVWERGGNGWRCVDAPHVAWPEPPEAFYRAMVVGLRDYVRKSGFQGVLLGLSGGVDSAISLVVARDALGAENVRAVMLPSRYTSQDSLDDAADCARRSGVRLDDIAISPAVDALTCMLAPVFEGRAPDITEENLQARIRGVTLMAMSNKLGAMLMTTGNKSEMAVGYATLYGDMCGGYNVLKDLYKEEVYAVCAWRNANAPYGGPHLGDPRARPDQSALGRAAPRSDRPGQPAALRRPRRHPACAGGGGGDAGRHRRARLRAGHGRARPAPALQLRIQAPPSRAGREDRLARVRTRPAVSDRERVSGQGEAILVSR